MKRLFIAAALLALTVAICLSSQWLLNRRVDRLLGALDDVEVAYQAGGTDTARPYAARLAVRFPEETRPLSLFLPHEHVDAAIDSALTLPALLEGDAAAFEAELARCRWRLEQLQSSERLTMENLL